MSDGHWAQQRFPEIRDTSYHKGLPWAMGLFAPIQPGVQRAKFSARPERGKKEPPTTTTTQRDRCVAGAQVLMEIRIRNKQSRPAAGLQDGSMGEVGKGSGEGAGGGHRAEEEEAGAAPDAEGGAVPVSPERAWDREEEVLQEGTGSRAGERQDKD